MGGRGEDDNKGEIPFGFVSSRFPGNCGRIKHYSVRHICLMLSPRPPGPRPPRPCPPVPVPTEGRKGVKNEEGRDPQDTDKLD